MMNSFLRISVLPRIIILQYSQKNFGTSIHLKETLRDVPTIRGHPLIGTLFSFLSSGGPKQLHKYIDNRHKEVGPIFKECIGTVCSVFVSDADMIRKIYANEGKYPKHALPESWIVHNKINDNRRGLYFMDGEEWFTCRKHLNKILLKDDFKIEIEKFENTGILQKHFESWLSGNENMNVVNLEEELYILSITFMVFYLLGTPFFENEHLFSSRIRQLAAVVHQIFECTVKLSTIPAELARKLNLKIWKDYVSAIDQSVKFSSELLVDMRACNNGDGILKDMLDLNLPTDLINRIVVDFIIAAGDTTATATQWLFYLLAKNKNIQNALYEELQTDGGGDRLLKNIIKESMRLYPVPPFIARYLPHDVDLPPYKLKAGDLVSISMYTCGRSEEYFPDAGNFNPDRWLRVDNGSKLLGVNNINASLPYSKGSRSCIGRKMSDAQLSSVIKKIITSYELDVENTVDIKLHLISVPSEPIKLHLKKRNKSE